MPVLRASAQIEKVTGLIFDTLNRLVSTIIDVNMFFAIPRVIDMFKF